jgi:DNA invertase Pin-like site-specific DNA recombinase
MTSAPHKSHPRQRGTAVAYLRVASNHQQDQDIAVPAQREVCQREADKIGVVIVSEFVDLGASGNASDRPGLRRLLSYITTRPIKYLIVRDASRLSRNRRDDAAIRQAAKRAGVTIVSSDEQHSAKPNERSHV